MITIDSSGSFERTEKFVQRLTTGEIFQSLGGYAEKGRAALAANTPKDSGLAASSWTTNVSKRGNTWVIIWSNSDTENGFPVVISLEYGYGTGTGGYVAGRPFISRTIEPIFDEIADAVWREVTRA